MSTRANIIVKDAYTYLIFYKHSDGYPKGTMPILRKFISLVKKHDIRDNVSQSCGWLIMLGAIDYQTITPEVFAQGGISYCDQDDDERREILKEFKPTDWKVGSIEPTTSIHGDIEHLYILDLEEKKIYTTTHFRDWQNTKHWKEQK